MHATQRCVSSVTAKDLLMLCMLAQAARYGEFRAGDHSSCTPVLHHIVRTSRKPHVRRWPMWKLSREYASIKDARFPLPRPMCADIPIFDFA